MLKPEVVTGQTELRRHSLLWLVSSCSTKQSWHKCALTCIILTGWATWITFCRCGAIYTFGTLTTTGIANASGTAWITRRASRGGSCWCARTRSTPSRYATICASSVLAACHVFPRAIIMGNIFRHVQIVSYAVSQGLCSVLVELIIGGAIRPTPTWLCNSVIIICIIGACCIGVIGVVTIGC